MKEPCDILQVEGINARGFGTIPKLVMQDTRLSAPAKAIYAYFCSFAGAGQQAFPRVTKIMRDLNLGRNAYYRHFNQLRDYGYIRAEQKHEGGRLSHNVYTLMSEIQCTQNRDTVQCTQKQHTEIQDAVFGDANKINKSENKHTLKSNSLSCPSATDDEADAGIEALIHDTAETVRANISYPLFVSYHPFDLRLLDEIIAVMVDALLSDSQHCRIDGEDKPRELVRHQLMRLDYEAIEHVLAQFKSHTGRIRKKRQYLLTMLYNAGMEIDAHYTNMVQTDLGGIDT